MEVTPQQKFLIRKSFALLEAQGTVPALVFYQRLFELEPPLRALFKSDIESQAAKLLDMLASLISCFERTTELENELRLMGQRHAGYGVKPAHYAPVGQALLDTLARSLPGDFTPEVREAWTLLYVTVADTMLAGVAQE